jgi:hypothetical protein
MTDIKMKNGDLVVNHIFIPGDIVLEYPCADDTIKIEQPGMAKDLDLGKFTSANAMLDWEHAAYMSYGYERCETEGIVDLADIFGKEFAVAFGTRRTVLTAFEMLQKGAHVLLNLKAQQKKANASLRYWAEQINNPSPDGFAEATHIFYDEIVD